MPDINNLPTEQDAVSRLTAMAPDTLTAEILSQVAPMLSAVLAEFQSAPGINGTGGTGRRFVPVTETRSYDGSGTSIQRVDDIVPGSAITVVAYPSYTIDDAVLSDNGYGLGRNELLRPAVAYPYVFPYAVSQGFKRVFPSGINNIAVTTAWGFAQTAPADVYEAVLGETISRMLVQFFVSINGVGVSLKMVDYELSTSAGISAWKDSSPIAVSHRIYLDTIARYRDNRQLQPAPTRTVRRMLP